jgi:Bifunctional DNA primase/polymerase, N-terminal
MRPDHHRGLVAASTASQRRHRMRSVRAAWRQKLGELPPTWTCLTPGGGVHYYLRHTTDERLHTLGPGLDIKYAGYVVAPPSIHPSGGRYRWDLGAHPLETPLAEVPERWLTRMRCGAQGLAPFAASGLDARQSFLGAAFEALGWLGQLLGEGRRCARCPWLDEHTDGRGDGGDSSTVLFSPALGTSLGGFHCSHAHCAGRRLLDVVRELPPHAIDAAARGFPDAYRFLLRRLAAEEGTGHVE